MSPLLKLSNVSKSFGPVRALSDISFELNPSEVVALVGDNGAGKSTLVKIISGALSPDEGHFWFEGAEVQIRKPEDARRLGIETVYQDLALFDNSNVAENIFAGREVVKRVLGIPFLRSSEMHARAEELLKTLKIHIQSTHYTVKGMSGGQRQSVAIARAVAFGRKVVILDEPTAALGVPEQQKVLSLVQDLKARGFSIIMISHNLHHIFEISDRIHVLRQGRTAGVRVTKDTGPDDVVKLITGGDLVRH
ncbi:ATP-binding cassette domain-containing protein [Microvirga sp. VF16]|uniref:ATP-binding cassette domain-containing protein n=1 Tax=Microvirga sp. VF16 TaxID=2807101 RepID=UPI00193E38D6|nr:ATP-binding cassette domain-containing protein [Microvirga sp. VF16]QRM33978.1 sugar ABC transporter ATP-binding protein [Microvirga sp. VF16]